MSWMSKFKQFLFGETEEIVEVVEYVRVDEEETVEEIKRERKQSHHQAPPKNVRAAGNQFETKIAYQYPAGNFRFPAIPDERKRQARPQQSRPANPVKSAEITREKSRRDEGLRPPGTVSKPAASRKIEPETKSVKKPFQPTIIPSPIYGFRKRSEMESLPYKIREKTIAESRMDEEETLRKLSMHSSSFYKKRAAEAAQKQAASDKKEFFAKGTNPIPDFPPHVQTDKLEDGQLEMDTGTLPSGTDDSITPLSDEKTSFAGYENSAFVPKENEKEVLEKHDESLLLLEEDHGTEDYLVNPIDEPLYFDEPEAAAANAQHVHNGSDEIEIEADPAVKEIPIMMEDLDPIQEEREEATAEETEPIHAVHGEFKNLIAADAEQAPQISMNAEPDKEIYVSVPNQVQSEQVKPIRTELKSQTASVPYNVLMLNRDRNRIKDRIQEGSYIFPPLHLLSIPPREASNDQVWLDSQRELLDSTLKNFNVRAKVVHVTQGPSVTRFEVQPEPGVKVNKITNLSDDIKLSLSAKDIRIEAPIPGKNAIGIEVPNLQSKTVSLREIIRSQEFKNNPSPLTVALGLDISGQPIVTDLKKMPHGLIAGATGSGKSVCINSMLISLLYKAAPHEVKMLLIDPKMVELAPYNRIPHLVSPVITDAKAATGALKWAVEEMERRYELFAHSGVRDISRYNELVKTHKQGEHMPYLVIVIDELADLMMVAPGEVEEAICRIAQKARACGIHLIVATQRPSVDVITGLIKANIPTRIAFSVSSQVDSRTILDVGGAEKLLGRGDMLFLENGTSKHLRVQGNFVSDDEMEQVVAHVKKQMDPVYLFNQEEFLKKSSIQTEEDDLFLEACEFVVTQNGASTSSLQRRFRIGYNRAARLIDMMEEQGIISEAKGSRPRDILISEDDLLSSQESNLL
ncbi:DNA translocase FtsK [Metabacillus sp. KIGAM252]|uniref:DNA translocase FtsK n=1 Tax=Metabacillus flavus TaxID=2823519 RepID=A0ABS5LH24_9BACI|nr:DNA translocase FtsK [Metabacillus flavus]MBS2970055.1 DNA translocase FtsK [Metabacillus flavus]